MTSGPADKDQSLSRSPVELSVVMACFNAEPFLEAAVRSALAQTHTDLEVLIVDDHSSDGSLALAQRLAASDPRVRVLQTPSNVGPGGARNAGIAAMRGEWYCMLDCDDALHPDRSRTLIDQANALGADMIADDLIVFGEQAAEHRHLGSDASSPPRLVSLDSYFEATQMYGPKPNLGFLKPLIRRAALEEGQHRYREDLRIGEDDELVIQLLLAGRTYWVTSNALYRYRKHEGSISHRLSVDHSARMLASEEQVKAAVEKAGQVSGAYRARYNSIQDAAAFSRTIEAIKRREWSESLRALVKRPRAVRHFSMPIASQLRKVRARLGFG